jgi:crotonobetainyl-CoA:carnitine CoA-transferase CaiB-like acyl-CoA transferase
MLSDLGADVIKVEPPEGDLTRFDFPRRNGIATYFTQQNCGKRNISLDLRDARAVETLLRIAEHCDILIENFRPGVMDRMGLGYDAVTARNPRVVYASITGYGHTGPWRDRRAYASVVAAECGLTWMQSEARGGHFANDPLSHGDVYTSLECLAGVLSALYRRERTGRGQWVEVSMAETLLVVNDHAHWELQDVDGTGEVPSFRPGDYPLMTLSDGTVVVVSGHPASKGTFERYVGATGRQWLLDDPRFASVAERRQHFDELIAELQAWAATVPDARTAEQAFAKQGLAMGVLRTLREVADSEWAVARGAIAEVPDRREGVVRIPNSPWHFSEAHSGVRGAPAYRGEHNREVLRDVAGLDDQEIDELEATGVLSSRVPR